MIVRLFVVFGLVLSACGSTSPDSTAEDPVAEDVDTPTSQDQTTTQEPTTMPTQTDGSGAALGGQAFVLTEQTHFGQTSQELVATVADISNGLPTELIPGDPIEDRQDGLVVVFSLPLSQISSEVEGFYLLSVTAAGAEPVAIRHAEWEVGESSATLTLETKLDGTFEATWAYSLQPRMRPVYLADEDGALGREGSVLHVADFGPGPVGAETEDLGDGWVRSRFVTPLWLTDRTPLGEACERVLGELGERTGSSDLQWAFDQVDEQLLDDAATAVEKLLPEGQQVNLTVEVRGREIVRGKRLQPFVRYPVTMFDETNSPTAATLGCSISPS